MRCRVACFALLLSCADVDSIGAQPANVEALRARGVQLVYEHEHDEAIKLLRQAVALAPDDPTNHRALANAIWLKMLFQRGAVTVDHYLGIVQPSAGRSQEATAGACG